MNEPILSVCTTVRKCPAAATAFLQSALDMATPQSDKFEIVMVVDRDEDLFGDLTSLVKQKHHPGGILLLNNTTEERMNHFDDNFTKIQKVYDSETIGYAQTRVQEWVRDTIDPWLQYAYGLNKAVRASRGSVLLLTPGDYVFLFDLDEVARRCGAFLKRHGGMFGHCSLVAPFDVSTGRHAGTRMLKDVYYKGTGHVLRTEYGEVMSWLRDRHAERLTYPIIEPWDRYWPANHGIRFVDKKTYEDAGGLPDALLLKSGPTDLFNRVARNLVPYREEKRRGRLAVSYPRMVDLIWKECRMALAPFEEDPAWEYLYPHPASGDHCRKLFYQEEKWFKTEHPKWAKFWT